MDRIRIPMAFCDTYIRHEKIKTESTKGNDKFWLHEIDLLDEIRRTSRDLSRLRITILWRTALHDIGDVIILLSIESESLEDARQEFS